MLLSLAKTRLNESINLIASRLVIQNIARLDAFFFDNYIK